MLNITPPEWPHHAPDNTVLYAIGDLHGHYSAYKMLYTLIEIEASKRPDLKHIVIFLGDYIDRGPDSSKIIESLRNLKSDAIQNVFLIGNHEYSFLEYMKDPHANEQWLQFGGIQTVQSYGCLINDGPILPSEIEVLQKKLNSRVPKEHLNFLNSLDHMSIYGDYAFVHAGIRPGLPLSEQKNEDLRFIREPFLSWEEPHEKCIIHGHSITKEPEIKQNRINVDTGLYKFGTLTCCVLKDETVSLIQVQNDDKN